MTALQKPFATSGPVARIPKLETKEKGKCI